MSTGYGLFIGFLLAAVALAVGAFILLWVVPRPITAVRAPYWTLQSLGALFLLSGLIAAFKTQRQWQQEQRRKDLAGEHPGSVAFADHPWSPSGERKSPWSVAVKAVVGSLFFALFLLPFNWWAWFSADERLFVRIVVGVFDGFLLLAFFETVRRILVALKYGVSGVEYARFPSWVGERAELTWFAPSGLEKAAEITFVLRCVEEWTETHGSGRDRSIDLIHEQLWGASQVTMEPVSLFPNQGIALSFDVPATVPGSHLARRQHRIFWELEVQAETSGVDFAERYLVPVYARATEAARGDGRSVEISSPAVEQL